MHERRCLLEDDDVDVRVFVKALVQPSCSIDRYYTGSVPSSAFDVRVASGCQHARRLSDAPITRSSDALVSE
ncbi:hypothetical protein OPV22_023373 [Ensete ventricosum]|uniref:Uncharacterized protein n=1 Tax=Ensete ventricosum TaxID=4639 RepID=A0AAV8PCQ2_ENSVE|nr:hypothetical protein OPV22_023373 [Ensete ventricosum]